MSELRKLYSSEIDDFTRRHGAKRDVVKEFLETVENYGYPDVAIIALNMKSRRYGWKKGTVKAIEEGIDRAIVKPSPKLRKRK